MCQVCIHILLRAYVVSLLQMLVEDQKHTYNKYQLNQTDLEPKIIQRINLLALLEVEVLNVHRSDEKYF